MSSITKLQPYGDPAKNYWTYADLAAVFDLTVDTMRRKMPAWERGRDPFPSPLPYYGATSKRWRPSSVLAWMKRQETACGARPVELELIQGGRR